MTACRGAVIVEAAFLSFRRVRYEEILFPSACAALYRREMIEQIGFFDDDFFAYCEDTDLGLRGRIAGWRAVLARDAVVYHRYSRSGGEFSPFKLYLVERNHYWVALKSFPLRMLLALPFWTFVRYLVQARMVLRSKGAGAQFRSDPLGAGQGLGPRGSRCTSRSSFTFTETARCHGDPHVNVRGHALAVEALFHDHIRNCWMPDETSHDWLPSCETYLIEKGDYRPDWTQHHEPACTISRTR